MNNASEDDDNYLFVFEEKPEEDGGRYLVAGSCMEFSRKSLHIHYTVGPWYMLHIELSLKEIFDAVS